MGLHVGGQVDSQGMELRGKQRNVKRTKMKIALKRYPRCESMTAIWQVPHECKMLQESGEDLGG